MFPLVGGRIVAHLKSNIDALSVELTGEDIDDIEKHTTLTRVSQTRGLKLGGKVAQGQDDVRFLKDLGYFDYVEGPKAVKAHKQEINGSKIST